VVGGVVVGGVVVGVVGQPIATRLMANNSANGINSNFLFTCFSSYKSLMQVFTGCILVHRHSPIFIFQSQVHLTGS